MPENRDIVRKEPDEIERRTDSLVQRSLEYLEEFEEQGLANVEEPDRYDCNSSIEFRKLLDACVLDDHKSVSAILEAGFILDDLVIYREEGKWALIPSLMIDHRELEDVIKMFGEDSEEVTQFIEEYEEQFERQLRYGTTAAVPPRLKGENPPEILDWLWVCTLYDSPKALRKFIDHIIEDELEHAGIHNHNWPDWSADTENFREWALLDPYTRLWDIYGDKVTENCFEYAIRKGKLGVASVFREYGLTIGAY